jgi:hypothetical protein
LIFKHKDTRKDAMKKKPVDKSDLKKLEKNILKKDRKEDNRKYASKSEMKRMKCK